MSDPKKQIAEFPDVENKLQAPTRKSVFERQKAEAEAKRLREEAETKAVYDDFVKSFDDEDDGYQGGTNRGNIGGGFSGPPPKRHFAPAGPALGRGFGGNKGDGGKLGSGPGSLGPPPQSLGRKRPFEGSQQRRDDRGLLAFDDYDDERPSKKPINLSDNEDERQVGRDEERAAPKPTLRLASLPPGTSPAVIKALLPSNLTVDGVNILPPVGPGAHSERKSISAIVTLAKDTPANDLDVAVNTLQNRYLGYGYYLNLHRHLSSAAISSATSIPALGSSTASQPFGAKPVDIAAPPRSHAPPPHQGRFAPPTSYAPSGPGQSRSSGPLLHVPVQPPSDIKELKLIHKVIQSLLTHGPEFEGLLMSRPDVQREEKWAWIWDSRSIGGVWYRWRLWEVLTGSHTRRGQGKYLPLFEGSSAWKQPDRPLAYEYTTRLEEFVSDSEYDSSDEDDSGDDGGARRQHHAGGVPPDPSKLVDDGKAYLNPLKRAKLTHLLARLPTTTGTLRKGDVGRVTAFAISHAGRGADEVVSMIVSNVEKPFAYTSANPDRRKTEADSPDDNPDEDDQSAASLIGVYLISDILSSSSTSGVRHAWRYRQLFESALKSRQVFENLGRMERKMNWGRLRAEKWKRSVENILRLWEGWCVFPQESQEWFMGVFDKPPLTQKEIEAAKRKDSEERDKGKEKSRWKAVEVAPKEPQPDVDIDVEDMDGEPMAEDYEDVDGVPMVEDEESHAVLTEDDENLDGEPMDEDIRPPEKSKGPLEETPMDPAPPSGRRQRLRAVDMFADSDEEN